MVPLAFRLIARHIRPEAGESLLLASHYAKLDRRLASSFFLQGPMWVGWTRPKIMALVKGIERIPLIGLAGEFVEGYIPLVDDYFYCECGQAFGADSRYFSVELCRYRGHVLYMHKYICRGDTHLRFISPFCSHLTPSARLTRGSRDRLTLVSFSLLLLLQTRLHPQRAVS